MSKATLPLRADGGHPAVRIDVIDSRFHTVASGFGRLGATLPRGLYTVRFSAGDVSVDEPVTLYPRHAPTDSVVPREPIRISAAMPLSQTSTTREYHREAARRLSQDASNSIGSGANLMVFVRDLDRRGQTSPATGLTLLDAAGMNLFDLGSQARTSRAQYQDAWAGCNLELNPGSYILRLDRKGARAVEMPVFAVQGWRTQIFATRSTQIRGEPVRRPDLSQANVLMNRMGEYFDSEAVHFHSEEELLETDIRLAELFRRALENRRSISSSDDMNAMLRGKWKDPMGGLLGAHVYALRPDPDPSLLETVLGNLTDILGDNTLPDLIALRIKLALLKGEALPLGAVEFPPVLRQSWAILTQASGQMEELIPPYSLAARIAGRLWGKSAWMLWLARDRRGAERTAQHSVRMSQSESAAQRLSLNMPGLNMLASRIFTHTTEAFSRPSLRFEQVKNENALASALERIERKAQQSDSSRAKIELGLEGLSESSEPAELLAQLEKMVEAAGESFNLDGSAIEAELTSTEFQVLSYVRDRNREESRSRRRYPERFSDPYAIPTLVRVFQLPASLIKEAVDGLFVKTMAIF